jgi:5-methylcytosine-specific restriction protein A
MALKKMCGYSGCSRLVTPPERYCERCKPKAQQQVRQRDQHRGSAYSRGYDYRWSKYSKLFLANPKNVFCKLQLPGCTNLAECPDHIDPPDGPDDPRFWDTNNHQPACLHCNSVKGHTKIEGKAEPFTSMKR